MPASTVRIVESTWLTTAVPFLERESLSGRFGGAGAGGSTTHPPPAAVPRGGQPAGQLASMFFSAVSSDSWPEIQAVMSFQNVPEPTADGIASDPSKANPVES